MLKRRTFFWLGIPLSLLVIGAIWGYYLYQKPHQGADKADVSANVSADSLFLLYQRNEDQANKLFLDHVIEVHGKLLEIKHENNTEIWILAAQNQNGPAAGGGINCSFFSQTNSPKPQPGTEVRVIGRCTGFLMDVNLADCKAD